MAPRRFPRSSSSSFPWSFWRAGRPGLLAFGAFIIVLQWTSVHYQHLRISNQDDQMKSTETIRRSLSACPTATTSSSFDWNTKPWLPPDEPRTWESQSTRPLNFVHIPKNGGSSVVQAAIDANLTWGDCLFQQHWPGRSCPHPPPALGNWTLQGDKVWWHMPIPQLPVNPYDGYDLFGIVRNPYDRAVSEFYYHCDAFPNLCKGLDGRRAARVLNRNIQKACKILLQAPHKSDEYFYHWGHWIPQYDFFYHRKGHRMIKHLLHTETLEDEFPSLVKAYNLSHLRLPPQPIKKRNDHRMTVRNLTLATVKLMEVVYERDFVLGNYELWSPKLSAWLAQQQQEQQETQTVQ